MTSASGTPADQTSAPPEPSRPPRAIARSAVVSWILYDLANTVFSMGVISNFFPLFVREQVGERRADAVYSAISAVAMGTMFLLSPLLGALTDRARRRMPFLIGATFLSCGATMLFGRGPFTVSAVLFVLAVGGYQAGVQFYDALLPEVTTDENRGRIGGAAIGIGYIGAYIALAIGWIAGTANKPLLFTAIALLFLALAVPCFVFVRERGNPNPRPIFGIDVIRESTVQTLRTLRESHRYPGLLRFLLGRAFYTDALNTVISYMAIYTVNVAVSTGLTAQTGEHAAQQVLATAITFAILGGIALGFVVDRIGPRRTLMIVLALWTGVFALAGGIGFFHLSIRWLYVVSCSAGIALGGTWASDRPFMLRLTPPDRVGEFYGLYGMVGRFSAVTGPGLWGIITYIAVQRGGLPVLTGEAFAIMAMLAMVGVAIWILRHVSDERRDWEMLARAHEARIAGPRLDTIASLPS